MPSPVRLIVARTSRGHVIGRDGKLPWAHNSSDMHWFKQRTTNHPIVMGRKTFDSIGRALPNRLNIVVSTMDDPEITDVHWYHSLDTAVDFARSSSLMAPIIIGGASLYNAVLAAKQVYFMYVTEIDIEVEGDTKFEFDESEWEDFQQPLVSGPLTFRQLILKDLMHSCEEEEALKIIGNIASGL